MSKPWRWAADDPRTRRQEDWVAGECVGYSVERGVSLRVACRDVAPVWLMGPRYALGAALRLLRSGG